MNTCTIILDDEQLARVAHNPDFFVSRCGEVYRLIKMKGMKSGRRNNPTNRYRVVALKDATGKRKLFKIAYIVLSTFVSPRPIGYVIRHGAKGRFDDSLDNLSYGTPKQNTLDRIRDGTMIRGEASKSSKITEKDVLYIRKHYSKYGLNGLSSLKLSRMFGLHFSTILDIAERRIWKHVK